MKVGTFLLLFLSGNVISTQVPILPSHVEYEGHVSENGGIVRIAPEIRAENGPICGFRIVNNDWGQIPFEIFMKSPENGTAELKARHPLDCESREKYELSIAAVACNGLISQSRPIHVIVDDDNEYIPLWSSQQYSASLEEGEMSPFIVKVEATDKDCSPQFGDVCDYSISGSQDTSFAINSQGIITNTEPLWSRDSRVHVVSVVAIDCGGKESSPVLVTINITPTCRNVWSDVSTSMTYLPGTGPQPLFPSAQLSLCPVTMCPVSHIETMISLHTQDVDTCDRDTFTVTNQKKLCGASNNAVDLLTEQIDPEIVFDNSTDEEDDVVGDFVFKFDGHNGAVVSSSLLSHDFGSEFTIQTWMKHGRKPGKQTKEQIVCLSDDHRKSRHHTALFVRNCKLVFLNRRHYDEDERNVFKPAEWRWTLPQVCDNRWHHYAVMVSQDLGAQLYVDGELFDQDGENTEIIDDWPLHPSANVETTLTVGGCWHGHEMSMMHGLTGSLAGLSLLTGKREHSQVLKCIVQCSESLQLPASNLLRPGMEMVTNSHGSMVTIDGDNVNNINTLIRQVAYLNTREFPVPGKRKVEMMTTVMCSDGSQLQVPMATSSVMVLPMPQPIIDISGTDNMSRDYESFKQGVRVFADIKLMVSQDDADFRIYNDEDEKIDHCSISVFPPLNPDHEELHIPQNMLLSLNIGGSASVTGVEIVGTNMVYNYEQVIRQVTYTNQKPAYYLNRQFKLSCSHLNNRFVSNEFIETLTVIHPSYDADIHPNQDRIISHQQMSRLAADLPQAHFFSQSRTYGGASSGLEQGNAVVVVVIVSMGLLITVLAVGVVKLKSVAGSRDDEADSVEMGWQDSANTNITINPLEATMSGTQTCHHSDSEFDEADSDNEVYEEDSDDCMDDTKERLAWDKSV